MSQQQSQSAGLRYTDIDHVTLWSKQERQTHENSSLITYQATAGTDCLTLQQPAFNSQLMPINQCHAVGLCPAPSLHYSTSIIPPSFYFILPPCSFFSSAISPTPPARARWGSRGRRWRDRNRAQETGRDGADMQGHCHLLQFPALLFHRLSSLASAQ